MQPGLIFPMLSDSVMNHNLHAMNTTNYYYCASNIMPYETDFPWSVLVTTIHMCEDISGNQLFKVDE